MASEIAVPAVASFNTNYAVIGYSDSNSSVYPGTKTLEWNVDINSLTYASYLALGSHTPNVFNDGARWIDFLDAACTVSNSASVFVGGSAAASPVGAVDPDRSLYLGATGIY